LMIDLSIEIEGRYCMVNGVKDLHHRHTSRERFRFVDVFADG
jgi:hypothetical protein